MIKSHKKRISPALIMIYHDLSILFNQQSNGVEGYDVFLLLIVMRTASHLRRKTSPSTQSSSGRSHQSIPRYPEVQWSAQGDWNHWNPFPVRIGVTLAVHIGGCFILGGSDSYLPALIFPLVPGYLCLYRIQLQTCRLKPCKDCATFVSRKCWAG